jgi:hypothetical protein
VSDQGGSSVELVMPDRSVQGRGTRDSGVGIGPYREQAVEDGDVAPDGGVNEELLPLRPDDAGSKEECKQYGWDGSFQETVL